MKAIMICLVLSIGLIPAFSQSDTLAPGPGNSRKMALEATAGYSIPFGIYAESDTKNEKSGCASAGWMAQLGLSWMGRSSIGLAVQYTYQRNQVENGFSKAFPDGMPVNMSQGNWSNHYLLAGPVFMKTFGKIHVDAKLLGGLLVSSSSVYDTPDPTDTTRYEYDSNIAAGFGYQVSAGVGYQFSGHFAVKFNLSLQGGWPAKEREYGSEYLGYKKYYDPITGLPYYDDVYSAPITYDMKKVVSTVNPSFGLVYKF
jgi:hypothetical protein